MCAKKLLLFGDGGELQAVVGDARADLRRQAGHYRILASTSELLILRRQRENGDDAEQPERVLMAGEIVERSTVLEVINVIVASRWAGTLHVFGDRANRALGFDRGVLRHASSDHPDDRLDKVLFRIGALSPAQAEALYRDAGPDERFGQVLVSQGLADREQLFHYLEKQMEQILLESVLEERGGYLFLVADDAHNAPTATAHIHLEQLLFIAAERLDRVAEIRRLIPDDACRPCAVANVDLGRISSHARLVMGHCDGERSVLEIASETRLGRFETLCALDGLVRARRVELLAPRRDAGDTVRRLVGPFNDSLDEIYGTLSGRELATARQEVRHWVESGEHRELLDGALSGEGLIRAEPLAEQLAGIDPRRPLQEMEGALHELVSFTLVAASTRLPRNAERELSRRVHERLRRVPA
jgi:hypothetical protein